MEWRGRLGVALMLAWPTVACAAGSAGGGSGGGGNSPGSGGTSTGGTGTGGGGSGTAGGGGAMGGRGGGNPTSTGTGRILIYDYLTTGFISASFRPAGSLDRISSGDCERVKSNEPTFSSAGTIVVSWDDPLSGPLTETLYPDTNYPSIYAQQVSSFPHGVPITVTASGSDGEVPPFSAVVTIPESNLSLVSPLDGQSVALTAPLVFEWTGAGGNTVTAGFATTSEDAIRCKFTAASASGSMPADLLSVLPTEDPLGIPYEGSLRLDDSDSTVVDLSSWQIEVDAVGHAILKDSVPISD